MIVYTPKLVNLHCFSNKFYLWTKIITYKIFALNRVQLDNRYEHNVSLERDSVSCML